MTTVRELIEFLQTEEDQDAPIVWQYFTKEHVVQLLEDHEDEFSPEELDKAWDIAAHEAQKRLDIGIDDWQLADFVDDAIERVRQEKAE
jgi:response regulator of citrate/malate metabolism